MPREYVSDRDLAGHLDVQIAAMQSVLAALEAEHQALKQRDGDALLQAVNGKAASLSRADELEKKRQLMVQQLGLAGPPVHGSRQFSADAGIAQRWQQVLALTRQCQAMNESNGQFIRGQRRRVDATLQLLRGGSAAIAEYGPGGQGRAPATTRSLGIY
jgi:flagellar biosynthesis/type III secretory pathway chaperone